ncbi:hypothetical protein H696_00441 [Fonticula alba]|uniref:Ras-GAP domain-containing protein n=1 Tax=Fonticula alba TaxID=691883 RepID=A0A058ZES2_FONAL|nr:hypothetical protein H696_00441 [Fonticula alba]KCV72869.1 hypothetical protein H696_00441 [Fonticula alba]|eukprot:XP_009492570.1 hypothetical protein H696_00441 [Fonticula alba]
MSSASKLPGRALSMAVPGKAPVPTPTPQVTPYTAELFGSNDKPLEAEVVSYITAQPGGTSRLLDCDMLTSYCKDLLRIRTFSEKTHDSLQAIYKNLESFSNLTIPVISSCMEVSSTISSSSPLSPMRADFIILGKVLGRFSAHMTEINRFTKRTLLDPTVQNHKAHDLSSLNQVIIDLVNARDAYTDSVTRMFATKNKHRPEVSRIQQLQIETTASQARLDKMLIQCCQMLCDPAVETPDAFRSRLRALSSPAGASSGSGAESPAALLPHALNIGDFSSSLQEVARRLNDDISNIYRQADVALPQLPGSVASAAGLATSGSASATTTPTRSVSETGFDSHPAAARAGDHQTVGGASGPGMAAMRASIAVPSSIDHHHPPGSAAAALSSSRSANDLALLAADGINPSPQSASSPNPSRPHSPASGGVFGSLNQLGAALDDGAALAVASMSRSPTSDSLGPVGLPALTKEELDAAKTYTHFVDLLANPNLLAVSSVLNSRHEANPTDILTMTVQLLHEHDRFVPLMYDLIRSDVLSGQSLSLSLNSGLFSKHPLGQQMLQLFIRQYGSQWLALAFNPIISRIMAFPPNSLQLDPAAVGQEVAHNNSMTVSNLVRDIVTALSESVQYCSIPIRQICLILYNAHAEQQHTAMSAGGATPPQFQPLDYVYSLMCHYFIGPALADPVGYGLIDPSVTLSPDLTLGMATLSHVFITFSMRYSLQSNEMHLMSVAPLLHELPHNLATFCNALIFNPSTQLASRMIRSQTDVSGEIVARLHFLAQQTPESPYDDPPPFWEFSLRSQLSSKRANPLMALVSEKREAMFSSFCQHAIGYQLFTPGPSVDNFAKQILDPVVEFVKIVSA